jgi:hypothetical protein
MISYIQVLDVFKTFAQGHLQLQKFDFEFREQLPNLATVDEAYPMLFVSPVGGATLENVREFDIDVYCVDRYQKNRSNVNYVISDTDLILGDLTRWLEEGQDDIEVVRTYTTTPINNDLLDYVGGHVMRMRVQVDRIALCEIPFDGEQPTPPTCPSAIVRNSDGSWSEIVASGGTYIVPDTPVTVTDQDGNELGNGDVPSVTGGNIEVTIAPSGDGDAVLKDTDGNVLSTTPVPPETTVDIVAPDADYEIRKSNGAMLYQGTILSGGALIQDIQDSTVRVRKSDNQVIQEVDVRAESVENYNVPDSTAVLKDTDGTTISTTPIKATESEDIVAPDGTVENSTGSYSDTVASGGTLVLPDETINIVDEDGNPIDSITFPVYTDPDIDISSYCPAATPPSGRELMPTGQTTVFRTGDDADNRLINGRAVDFFTLDYTNPFGNTNRFTDELGGTTYANNIVIDWSTYNAVTGKVLGYKITEYAVTSWNQAIDDCLATSIGIFISGWALTNVIELENICWWASVSQLNHSTSGSSSPFALGGTWEAWTSTTYAATGTSAISRTHLGTRLNRVKTGTAPTKAWACRQFTVTGTTLT